MPTSPDSGCVLRLAGARAVRKKGGFTFTLHVPRFVVRPGEFLVLSGPNGCGKSTCLDLLALILAPQKCEAFAFMPRGTPPVDILRASAAAMAAIRRRHLGYVMQNGGLLPFLNVRQNILLPAIFGGTAARRDMRFDELTTRLGLGGHLRKKPHQLSGGQRQRAAIARALIHRPVLVLADEPTAFVERPAAVEIVAQLKHLCQSAGASVVFVTHDEQLVRGIADRCYGFDVSRSGAAGAEAVCVESSSRPT